MIKKFLYKIGVLFSFLHPIAEILRNVSAYVYTGYYSKCFGKFGNNNLLLPRFQMTRGLKSIEIGSNCIIGHSVQLTLWKNKDYPNAKIEIGDNCAIGDNSHITAYNCIRIGNNVLMGKRVLITDNAHGATTKILLSIPPYERPLFSKGPVIISDNVWIGEKVSILPGVTIGFGAIIGANSVITKNIPPYTVVGGNPAKIIKVLK